MMRRTLASAAALSMVLACASCSAPAKCNAQPDASQPRLVESDERADSLLLTDANESQVLLFRATLSGLPVLWPNEEAVQGAARLGLELRYESEPLGGDGHTEMPRLVLALGTRGTPTPTTPTQLTTSKYPGPEPILLSAPVFEDCALGSSQCQTSFGVFIQRVDGVPFPPLRVSTRVTADANLNTCSALSNEARVTLEVETP